MDVHVGKSQSLDIVLAAATARDDRGAEPLTTERTARELGHALKPGRSAPS